MEFIPITKEEFYQKTHYGKGPSPSLFNQAVTALKVGEAFSTQCTWKHRTGGGCSGLGAAHGIASRHHRRVLTSCTDGIVYVLRREDKEV
jgi:hypothetical protein